MAGNENLARLKAELFMERKAKVQRARPALARDSVASGDVANLRLALMGVGSRAAANAPPSGGHKLLCRACLAPKNAAECVQILLEAGADPLFADKLGQTALHWASRWGKAACARILIAAGADPNARTTQGKTSLHLCLASCSIETIQALLDGGGDPLAQAPDGHSFASAARAHDPKAKVEAKDQPRADFMTAVAEELLRWELARDLAPGTAPRRSQAL